MSAAAIMSRRERRSAIPERLKVAARDDSSDDELDPDEAADASDEEGLTHHYSASPSLHRAAGSVGRAVDAQTTTGGAILALCLSPALAPTTRLFMRG